MLSYLPGILYLCGIGAFALVVLWVVTADAPGNRGGTSGFFAMKDEEELKRRDKSPSPPWKT